MMRIKPAHALIAFNLVLAAGLAYLWLDDQGQPRDLSWQPPAPLVPDTQAFELTQVVGSPPDMLAFAQVIERPLFSPTRRPPPPPKPPTPPAPPPPPDPLANVHVFGIFVGEEEGTGGMLASIDGKVRRLTAADEIAGWKIKGIKEREITLTRGEETRVLRLAQARPSDPQRVATAPPRPVAAASRAPAAGPSGPLNPAYSERAARRRAAEERANARAQGAQ